MCHVMSRTINFGSIPELLESIKFFLGFCLNVIIIQIESYTGPEIQGRPGPICRIIEEFLKFASCRVANPHSFPRIYKATPSMNFTGKVLKRFQFPFQSH